jgi:hypothetical protein
VEISEGLARTVKLYYEVYEMEVREVSDKIDLPPDDIAEILRSDEYEQVEVNAETPSQGMEFYQKFASVMTEIGDLLDMRFTPQSERGMEEFLYKISNDVLMLDKQEKLMRRDYELCKLNMFCKHLSEIQEENRELFNRYKQELNEVGYDRYFGIRFELDIAASLIRKGINYSHPDPPDFEVQYEGKELAIECTSAHFSGGDRTKREKFTQCLTSKSSKDYFNRDTALFIDVTNLDYAAEIGITSGSINEKDEKRWIRECTKNFDLDIGSVVIFRYIGHGQGIGHQYRRCDIDSNIAKHLQKFLDEHYPIGDVRTETLPYHFRES